MSRGFGKYRRGGGSHSSFNFDNLFKENANKPSAARSAATVGKWGITSFTSIRTINGLSQNEEAKPNDNAPKPKKFFKSRNNDKPESNLQSGFDSVPSKKPKYSDDSAPKSNRTTRRFFSSKNHNSAPKSVPTVTESNSKRNEKPPIVLRICRGKSQLVNDSDESESTPTPATVPSTSQITSPRSARETTQQRSGTCRITRSARRSLQQDPNSSPATADTPSEFSLFTTAKHDTDLSPQYIPAEKYELERKAMYDNLLNPSPSESSEHGLDHSANSEDQDTISKPDKDNTDLIDTDIELESPVNTPIIEQTNKIHFISNDRIDQSNDTLLDEHNSDSDLEESMSSQDTFHKTQPVGRKPESPSPENTDNLIGIPQQEETAPVSPVKLVISKKKGSIFKSRSLIVDGTTKRRALYKHKWSDDKDPNQKNAENPTDESKDSTPNYNHYGFKDEPLVRVVRSNDIETMESNNVDVVTSIKCSSGDKNYYTVVKNVKKAHQMQEIGEFQEFNDDVEYILDALKDNNPISTRCLSAITLASKCMVPAFRMHVRAHGTVGKFFKALHDATKDQSLGLCTATVMFVLSQDRLNMDIDRDSLELMLNLLESDVSYQQALDVCGLSFVQLEKNKQKVRELCAEIQSHGHAMHLNLDNITVGQLAMETLLSLTCKRAGEWFKEELRELGGLEQIMNTICECCRQVSDYVVTWTDSLLDKLRKVDRCLRVLENVTHNNEENQNYLLKYNNGTILDTLVSLYKLCDREIPLYPVVDIADKESAGSTIREALLVTLKVLINLTHHFNKQSKGSSLIGTRQGVIETSLHLLLQVPHYIPDQKKFELGVLVLMLLINLVQDNEHNKKLLIDAKAPAKLESIYSRDEGAVEALVAQFYHWDNCAKIAEKRTNAILDGEKDDNSTNVPNKTNEEFIEETVAKLLQKAGSHMEYTLLASYIVMVIGFLIMDNNAHEKHVRQHLKGNSFNDMIELLKKYFSFMNLTSSTEASSVTAMKATEKVIKYLEQVENASQRQTSE